MNKEIISDEVKWLLEAINEQYETIQSHGEKIPQIEFDILMENIRKFYDNMRLLKRLNEPPLISGKLSAMDLTSPRAGQPVTEPVVQSPPIQPGAGQPWLSSAPGLTVQFSDPEPAEMQPVVAYEPELSPFATSPVHFKPQDTASVQQASSPGGKKPTKHSEIDLFASEEPAFSIKLKDAREKTFGPKIPSHRIDNLKTAITINEKFMFINELFDGNLREYNETIETLNGFKTLDQAAEFLDLLRKKNFWNTGSNAFKKLKELVERRF